MKKMKTTVLLSSLLTVTALLTGCGTSSLDEVKRAKDTTKLIRGTADDTTDWTWFVGTDGTQSTNKVSLTTYFMHGVPSEVKHFQYFLDTDNDANTGFSFGEDSWRITGADILVEDGDVYTSQSKTEWKWSYVGRVANYTRRKAEGLEKINFIANKVLLGIKSDIINVTIEPFDENWDSTYSTISTQAVTLVAGEEPKPEMIGETIEKMLNKHTVDAPYHVIEASQLNNSTYLVSYTAEYHGGGDGHSIIAIFSTETQKVIHTLSNQNLDGGPGTNKAFHINIDKGTNTISYDREMGSFEPFYSRYAPSILHTTYNYDNATSKTYRGTDDATWNKIRRATMKNFRGLPLKKNGIFLVDDKAYVISHKGATYYFASYDITGTEAVFLNAMPENANGIHDVHMGNSGNIVYTIKGNIEVTYNPQTGTHTTKQL